MLVKVTSCTVELVFDIWDNEVDVKDVPKIIEEAVERSGYSLSSGPNVVMTRERTEEM